MFSTMLRNACCSVVNRPVGDFVSTARKRPPLRMPSRSDDPLSPNAIFFPEPLIATPVLFLQIRRSFLPTQEKRMSRRRIVSVCFRGVLCSAMIQNAPCK